MLLALSLFAIMTAVVGVADAQEASFKVVAHPALGQDSVSARDLKNIFLKRTAKWSSGERANPVDQKATSSVRKVFTSQVLGKTMAAVDSYWQAQVFSGKTSVPPTVSSDREVLEYVRSNPGAAGYVSQSASTGGVKVLKIQ